MILFWSNSIEEAKRLIQFYSRIYDFLFCLDKQVIPLHLHAPALRKFLVSRALMQIDNFHNLNQPNCLTKMILRLHFPQINDENKTFFCLIVFFLVILFSDRYFYSYI